MDQSKILTKKLLDLMQETGYPLVQHNGQRRYGPPPDWTGSPPPKGCEVFVGKLPREIYEDLLVPIFSKVGKIYEMRLMMDFSGSNRGYAFVTYATRAEATRAVRELNQLEIQPGKQIGVVMSVDNCRLFVGGIPKTKTKEEVLEEMSKRVGGIVDVILYQNCFDRNQNRGFAFVEFTSHRAAAMARRALVPGSIKLWDQEVMVDWAEPEPYVDDEKMQKVKVLYVRNFLIETTPDKIREVFERAVDAKLEHVKKIYDYAFVHFYERAHAELAMTKLQNSDIDGSTLEIKWAKPVDRDLYRIQKMSRGNAKFNNTMNFSQTMLLYKQHLGKKEYERPQKHELGSHRTTPLETLETPHTEVIPWGMSACSQGPVSYSPTKLDSICKRFMWALPVYEYQKFIDPIGKELWFGRVTLPLVGQPLLAVPQQVGPLVTSPCSSMQEAYIKASEAALSFIKALRTEVTATAAVPAIQPVQPVYPQILPQLQSCSGLAYDYPTPAVYTHPQTLPVPIAAVWRNV